jgi:hypothetical protein
MIDPANLSRTSNYNADPNCDDRIPQIYPLKLRWQIPQEQGDLRTASMMINPITSSILTLRDDSSHNIKLSCIFKPISNQELLLFLFKNHFYTPITMEDEENQRRMVFSITNIPMLEESTHWDLWERNSKSWILNHDLDTERPAIAARGRAWDRNQLKGVGQLHTRCGKRAYNLTKDCKLIHTMIEILKPVFEEHPEGTFGEVFNEFNTLCLADCKNVIDYNTRFDNSYSQLCKFVEVKICRPLLVKKYLEGLGTSFDQWLSTFNHSHPLLKEDDVEGVSLKTTMTAARIEEQKMTSRTSYTALLASRSGNANTEPQGTKRQHGDKHCKVHLWCGHEDAQCITQHPELEAYWNTTSLDTRKDTELGGQAGVR